MSNCSAPESLKNFQLVFGQHLRDPHHVARPAGLPVRRVKVYRELLFNNLCGYIDSCFPVCKTLLKPAQWRRLCRVFFRDWRSQTPYFSQIPGEFLQFLQLGQTSQRLPGWFLELAHYEWVELAVDICNNELPSLVSQSQDSSHPVRGEPVVVLNPSAKNLYYHWPVHKICAEYRPRKPQQVFLVVYRSSKCEVKFVELSAATSVLLNLIERQPANRALLLGELAKQLQVSNLDAFTQFGNQMIDTLITQEILFDMEATK